MDPKAYPQSRFPHLDVSDKKVHQRTPYYALLNTRDSVKKIKMVIGDMMHMQESSVNGMYKPVDYVMQYQLSDVE